MLGRLREEFAALKHLQQYTKGQIVTAISTILLSTYLIYLHIYNKCDMQSILLPLLQVAARQFATVNATYFLDYGSLLGAVRDGGIIPYEFDIDMAVMEEDCNKFLALKDAFKAEGLTMYQRGDYIAAKKSVIMGYDAYLHKACARIYDQNFKYYIDFDWYKRYTYQEAMKVKAEEEAKPGGMFLVPEGYKESDGDIICNIEAFDGSWPGGCRFANSVFPLKPINVLGVPQWIPNNPELNLEQCYGPDWRTPRPKGYKLLVCGWLPVDHFKFFFVWAILSSLPYGIYLAFPLAWNWFQVAIGRKNATCKYSTLPMYSPKA